MTGETTDLKRRLEQVANTPRPRPQIDITGLAVRGRRILRVRRACAVAGSAVAVGLVATLMATGLPRLGAVPDRPASPATTPTSRPNTGAYPNPLVQRAVFGWLPKGYTTRSVIEDHQNGRHTFEATAALDGGRHGIVDLTDFGAGPEPILGYLSGGIPARPRPAAPVKGKQAHWITNPGTGSRLRWQYGSHRWAELSVQGRPDNASTIYRIAASITFGTAKPTPFPFRATGLPTGLKVYLSADGPGLGRRSGDSAYLDFSAGAYTPNNSLSISVTAAGLIPQRIVAGDPGREVTVDGHRAIDRQSRTGGVPRHTLIVFGVGGFDVTVSAHGQTLERLEATGGVMGLYHRITVLGTDPSRWTTMPLA
jgi:hypothetical protein